MIKSFAEADSAVVSDVAEITEVVMISSIEAEFDKIFELFKEILSLVNVSSGLRGNGLRAFNTLILGKVKPLRISSIGLPVFRPALSGRRPPPLR